MKSKEGKLRIKKRKRKIRKIKIKFTVPHAIFIKLHICLNLLICSVTLHENVLQVLVISQLIHHSIRLVILKQNIHNYENIRNHAILELTFQFPKHHSIHTLWIHPFI